METERRSVITQHRERDRTVTKRQEENVIFTVMALQVRTSHCTLSGFTSIILQMKKVPKNNTHF